MLLDDMARDKDLTKETTYAVRFDLKACDPEAVWTAAGLRVEVDRTQHAIVWADTVADIPTVLTHHYAAQWGNVRVISRAHVRWWDNEITYHHLSQEERSAALKLGP
jgi:hypothetical protein